MGVTRQPVVQPCLRVHHRQGRLGRRGVGHPHQEVHLCLHQNHDRRTLAFIWNGETNMHLVTWDSCTLGLFQLIELFTHRLSAAMQLSAKDGI